MKRKGPAAISQKPLVKVDAVGTPSQELNFLKWLIEMAERHHENTRNKTTEAA